MYACMTGNVRWFRTLFRMTIKSGIVNVRSQRNETLYHLVCTLSEKVYIDGDNKATDRLQILNTLLTTNIDMNVQTNTSQQLAFERIAYGSQVFVNDNLLHQLLRWWLDHLDRFDNENRNRCLPWLAYDGRLEAVQRLCRMDSTDLNIGTALGATALVLASHEGHTSIVEELLTYYPHRLTADDLNHQDMNGDTALHAASQTKHLDTVQLLCRLPDADLSIPNQKGNTALTIAADRGHTSIVAELLSYYPHRLTATDLNHQNEDGYTALHSACAHNHLAIVRSLCRIAAVDLSLRIRYGNTALITAADSGHKSIVAELLSYYPHRLTNLNQLDDDGYTALHSACLNNHLYTVQLLCRQPDVILHQPTQDGYTALAIAASQGNTSIVDYLLLTYYPHRLTIAALNHQNQKGNTALYLACEENHFDTVDSLCSCPAVNLNIPNVYGTTALIIAANRGNTEIIKELLDYYFGDLSATVGGLNHQSRIYGTALHTASRNNHIDIVKALCHHPDVDLRLPTKKGDTALMIAADRGYTSIVDELLTYYPHRLSAADLNHRNEDGDSALSIARRQGYTQIMEALRNHGVVD